MRLESQVASEFLPPPSSLLQLYNHPCSLPESDYKIIFSHMTDGREAGRTRIVLVSVSSFTETYLSSCVEWKHVSSNAKCFGEGSKILLCRGPMCSGWWELMSPSWDGFSADFASKPTMPNPKGSVPKAASMIRFEVFTKSLGGVNYEPDLVAPRRPSTMSAKIQGSSG